MKPRTRVLVIDDEPLFRHLVASMLRRDYAVSMACEGSEGYYKAIEDPPDIALVDVQMPGWDGLKTLKAFRTHPILATVKVVILTGDASKETVLAAIHGGASEYLVKTHLSREMLHTTLEKLVPTPASAGDESPEPFDIPPASGILCGAVAASSRSIEEIMDNWE
ncbi:MAG: response regulator [Planctomycetaceae bacterium]|nr:response regulator [Planctomycetaceae bacterium]